MRGNMTSKNRKLFILLAVIAAVVGFVWLQQETIRYRVTVTVDKPDGVATGSSVMEVSVRKTLPPHLPQEHKADIRFRGEAVSVELPSGQILFALIGETAKGQPLYVAAIRALYPDYVGGADQFFTAVSTLAERNSRGKKADLPSDDYPLLVRFRDIDDPKSVELVDPQNLAASFGNGTSLNSITIEVTDDPVTTGIEKRLVWIKSVGQHRATLIPNPPRLLKDAKPAQLVAPSDFSTEIYK